MSNHRMGVHLRRSERVMLRIPIRVEGKDAFGNAFDETTYTLVVNQSGGLIAVSHPLQPGAVIKITNLKSQISRSFEVVMRAETSLTGNPEWGVKCLGPEVEIWGVHFPPRTGEPSPVDLTHALLECGECSSREMAPLTMGQYRKLVAQSYLPRPCPTCGITTGWRFASIEVGLGGASLGLPNVSASGSTPQSEAEKRRDKPLAVKLPMGIRLPDGSEEITKTESISESGLCFACNLEMQIGDRLYVSVGLDPEAEQCDIPARIVWRRPAEGKGRAFYWAELERRE